MLGTSSSTKRFTVAALLAVAVLVAGCSSDPYRDAYIRFAETGQAIQPHLEKAPSPDVDALYKSFDDQVKTGLAEAGK